MNIVTVMARVATRDGQLPVPPSWWLLLLFSALGAGWSAAEARVPLLMEGKKTLYQRVLARPGAALATAPGATGVPIPPFSVLFVYSRAAHDGEPWIEVGASERAGADGWLPATAAIDWKQTMTVAFTNPAGRTRLPLFKDKDFVLELLESELAVKRNQEVVEKLSQAQTSGQPLTDLPAVSIEPATYVDFTKQFYLLPILEAEQLFFADGFSARLLKVASVSENDAPEPVAVDPNAHRQFKTAITFVVDATSSMGPYINEMRATIERVYDTIAKGGLSNKVVFGLVAYRDNLEAAPGLEYVSKVFADFDSGASARSFLDKAAAVAPATVSSQSFNEDAHAGVLSAINELDWAGYGGRYVVVITDAAPRDGADPSSSSGLSGVALRQLAREQGIAIVALHLLTKEGARNHKLAEERLSVLSAQPQGSLYYGVEAGDAQRLGDVIESLAVLLTEQVAAISEGRASEHVFSDQAATGASADPQLARLRGNIAKVGYAMQLAYLGRTEGTKVPSVFEAWVADRDVSTPNQVALEVRVLLNKNQLSDLQEALKSVIYAGEIGQISPESFFDEIRSAAAALARDPSKVGRAEYKNLGETGLLSEYLDGLPYRSKVMNVSRDLWLSWSIGEQQAFLDDVESKIRLYQQFHDDVARWKVLSGNTDAGEAVYPVPLEALP